MALTMSISIIVATAARSSARRAPSSWRRCPTSWGCYANLCGSATAVGN